MVEAAGLEPTTPSPQGMDDVYNWAEYLEEKRRVLQMWADWIEGTARESGRILQFPKALG